MLSEKQGSQFFRVLALLLFLLGAELWAGQDSDTVVTPSVKDGAVEQGAFGASPRLAPASQEVLERFSKSKSKTEAYNSALNELAWENPAPGVNSLGLSIEELEGLVGDRIVLLMHAPRTVDVPYYGEMIRWHNARFVSAVTELTVSADRLRQMIIDNDQKNGWKDVEPFVKSTGVLYRDELDQVGLRYKIQAKLSILRVNGNVYARNRYEENGDISSLFLSGDFGVSVGLVPIIPKAVLSPLTIANVRRWEFIDLGPNRSLVVINDWAEVINDSPLSKRMSQYEKGASEYTGLSDEDLVGPYPGVAVNMSNFKNTVLRQLEGEVKVEAEPDEVENETVLEKGLIPDFIQDLPKPALHKMTQNGPVVFIHPRQDIKTDYGAYPLYFVSAAYPVEATFDDLRRYSSQMNHYADYVPQLNSSTIANGDFSVPNFAEPFEAQKAAEVDFEMSLGKRVKFISSFNLEYRMRYTWERKDRLSFEAIDGEIETVLGAVEWLPGGIEGDGSSLLFYTSASDLGPNPKFPLNLAQKIPGADVAGSVITSTMAAGRQGPWVEGRLREEKSSAKEKSEN